MILAEGARYRITPQTTGRETLYASAAQLEANLARARPGQSFIYARGPALDPAEPTARLVRSWIDEGKAIPLKPREDGSGVLCHFVKLPELVPAVTAKAEFAAAATALDQTDFALLELFDELAATRAVLPNNDDLAERLGLPDRHATRYRIGKLKRAGLITVARIGTMPGGGTAREITITSTGARLRSQVAGEKA